MTDNTAKQKRDDAITTLNLHRLGVFTYSSAELKEARAIVHAYALTTTK